MLILLALCLASLFFLAALVPVAAAQTEPAILPIEDWPHFRKDAPNTGASTNDAPEENELYWVFGGEPNPNFPYGFVSSPAVVEGVVYAGSSNGHLYGLDEGSGTVVFDFTAPEFTASFGPFPIWSSPAVDTANGLIYVAIDNLYAIDLETAEVIWTIETNLFFEFWSSPTFEDNVVYYGEVAGENGYGILHALEATTGNELWSFETGEREYNPITGEEMNKEAGGAITATTAVGPDLVYIVDWDENLYAVDKATGELVFIQGFEETVPGTNIPIEWGPIDMGAGDGMASVTLDVANDQLYVGDTAGNFWALSMDPDDNGLDDDGDGRRDNEGKVLWKETFGDAVSASAALYNEAVYVTSWDQTCYAYTPEGQLIWQQPFSGYPWGSVTAADNKVFFGTIDFQDNDYIGWLYALDAASGEVVWSLEANDWFIPTPTPYNGKLFTGVYATNHLAAFAPDGPKPDLYIVDVTVSDEFGDGERIVYATLGNRGGISSPPAELQIYVDDKLEYNKTFDPLEAGELAAANVKLAMGGGGHEVRAKVIQRPEGWYHIEEPESTLANNEMTISVGGVVGFIKGESPKTSPVMFLLGLAVGAGTVWFLAGRERKEEELPGPMAHVEEVKPSVKPPSPPKAEAKPGAKEEVLEAEQP